MPTGQQSNYPGGYPADRLGTIPPRTLGASYPEHSSSGITSDPVWGGMIKGAVKIGAVILAGVVAYGLASAAAPYVLAIPGVEPIVHLAGSIISSAWSSITGVVGDVAAFFGVSPVGGISEMGKALFAKVAGWSAGLFSAFSVAKATIFTSATDSAIHATTATHMANSASSLDLGQVNAIDPTHALLQKHMATSQAQAHDTHAAQTDLPDVDLPDADHGSGHHHHPEHHRNGAKLSARSSLYEERKRRGPATDINSKDPVLRAQAKLDSWQNRLEQEGRGNHSRDTGFAASIDKQREQLAQATTQPTL